MDVSKKWRAWIVSLLIFPASMFLMDSCMQFRMSKSEIDAYFSHKQKKGVIHRYQAGDRIMNYLEVGDSTLPLVVFIHGSPGSLSAFIDFMADSALLSNAELISVDRPGFGDSNFGYAEPSLTKQGALLKPILERHKNQRPVILVGHSLGGPLIARMAMDSPELIDGLIMVAPSIDPEIEPNEWFRGPLATPFLKWMLPRSIRASNDEIYHLKPELEEMLPLWPKITASTIVIQGNKDTLVPKENAEFAKKMMVNASVKLITVEDMNHFVPWTHPYLIRDAILEMIKSIKARNDG
jgi:pimeloyl-ACP methyl ester carboxylesterase